ncbi:CUB and zona pellucida-like domain-containing protein 1 [Haliotis cracherodii]|uniref:CUB and zona pellucida-like domain-containing protein 1 n=1 Tax=Haliotis cracherodii TaxID=6455 RepID=UPI0039E8F01F
MLRRPPSDVSHIYMATHACTGTLQGHLLVFNVSYNLCHTKIQVAQDKVIFSNDILYTLPSPDNVTRDVVWRVDVECSHLLHEIDTVHIYPQHNSTNHITVSGQIQGSSVHISLFKDPAYQVPFVETLHKAQLGQPIFVQVSSPQSENTIMIINTCHAHLTNDSRSPVSHILIENGCPVDERTKMLVSRYQMIRFTFDMFDLPNEDEDKGLYVTCNVTFCDQMDFSPNCQQVCQTHPHVGFIG